MYSEFEIESLQMKEESNYWTFSNYFNQGCVSFDSIVLCYTSFVKNGKEIIFNDILCYKRSWYRTLHSNETGSPI